ncbi:cytochrome c peroxidase [Polyangium spumosum]|uniref:Cytochrome c domain-containing protein n=1 Tax=Polyangium spumosum TaxID=889282 RepID=A0A6N7PSE0_9BACT|nr:hypothetical protein [Polyangium spumosum]
MTKSATFFASAAVLLSSMSGTALAQDKGALEDLGKYVFFDKISSPPRQACATCHVAKHGWTAGVAGVNKNGVVVPGADPKAAGRRKPPSSAYASFSPPFATLPKTMTIAVLSPEVACTNGFLPLCYGGAFWDGRAEGRDKPFKAPPNFTGEGAVAHVGSEIFSSLLFEDAYEGFLGPLADQALGPFPNDNEQNVPDGRDHGLPGAEAVCLHVASSDYAPLYTMAWGEPINCRIPDIAFKRVALALAAWQHSDEVNSFSSKRDMAARTIDAQGREVLALPFSSLTPEENLGHDLFYGRNDSGLNPELKAARCNACHSSGESAFLGPALASKGDELDQIYSDFAYHSIGLPPNCDATNYDPDGGDAGILSHADPSAVYDELDPDATPFAGHFKTPTLRNVDKRQGKGFPKAYMHNGYFKTLEQVVHFYNTSVLLRDHVSCPPCTTAEEAMERGCWPEPEFNIDNAAENLGLIGDLELTEQQEAALVAYLRTLSDTLTVDPPKPFKGKPKGQGKGKGK